MRTPSVSRRTLLAGASVGALAGAGGATLKLGPDAISTRVDSPGWPLVHHDTRNTGFNRHADGPASDPDVRWRADRFDPEGPFRGYAFLPPAVVADDRVYVGGRSLAALGVEDGREAWSVSDDGETYHGAAYADGDLFVATWREADGTPGVAAFDATAGDRRWHRTTDTDQTQAPLVAGETVYLPSLHTLTAFDRGSGDQSWRMDDFYPTTYRPAVTDDALYLPEDWQGLGARDRRRDALATLLSDPPDVRWRYEPEEMAAPAPAVGESRVFAPETEEWHPHHDDEEGVLAALAPDGSRLWSKPGGTLATTPVVGNDRVFYEAGANLEKIDRGSYVRKQCDARVTAHDPGDGRVEWTRTFTDLGSWRISPVGDGERLYVPLHDSVGDRSSLVALDAATGETRWRRTLDSPAYHLALAGQTLYVSTENGTLLAFE